MQANEHYLKGICLIFLSAIDQLFIKCFYQVVFYRQKEIVT